MPGPGEYYDDYASVLREFSSCCIGSVPRRDVSTSVMGSAAFVAPRNKQCGEQSQQGP